MAKKITLKKLELTNYRNIEHEVCEFDGNSQIVGENRIGKTNTLEAIYFLLTNYLLNGSKDLNAIKPLADTKRIVCIEGTFEVEGRDTPLKLKKEVKEIWRKRAGQTELSFDGNTEIFYYDDVKQSTISAYNTALCSDFGLKSLECGKVDFIKMLIDPSYLGNMGDSIDWTELRNFIINLVGDVSDDDIFNRDASTMIIKEDLKLVNGRIDQIKKKYAASIKGFKDEIVGDDAKIKAYEETYKPTDEEVALAKKGIEEHQENINRLKNSIGVDEQSKLIKEKISQKELEIAKRRDVEKTAYFSSVWFKKREIIQDGIVSASDKLVKQNDKRMKASKDVDDYTKSVEMYREKYKKSVSYRDELYKKLNELSAKKDSLSSDTELTVCPICGQQLPPEKASEQINQAKEKIDYEIQRLIASGKENAENQKYYCEYLEQGVSHLEDAQEELKKVTAEWEETKKEIEMMRNNMEALGEAEEFKDSAEIESMQLDLDILKKEYSASVDAFSKGQTDNNVAIADEQEAMKPFQKVLEDNMYWERQQTALENARQLKVQHGKQLADVEQKKQMLDRYIYVKLQMLDENVSKVFGNIRFQLIQENATGSFDPVCKPYIYDTVKEASSSVIWKNGSKSEKVATGIAIVEKIKVALDLPNLPYLFDEGGEISADTLATRLPTESQLICVKVKDGISSPLILPL